MNERSYIHSHKEGKTMKSQSQKPRKVHVQVNEQGNQTADIRLPYGIFRLGLKQAAKTTKQETDPCARALAKLKDFDCALFERAIATGEMILPHVILDATETDSNTHVVITAE